MILGVVSDSHGNLEGLRVAASNMLKVYPIDLFIHLGDDFDDALVFEEFSRQYIRVPGVFSDYYQDRSIPNRIVRIFEGWRFLLTHTETSHANDLPDDPRPEDLIGTKQVDVVLHGHTHVPRLEELGGILFINPGHLKEKDKKGMPASYAVVEVLPESIRARLVELKTGRELEKIERRRS